MFFFPLLHISSEIAQSPLSSCRRCTVFVSWFDDSLDSRRHGDIDPLVSVSTLDAKVSHLPAVTGICSKSLGETCAFVYLCVY